MFALSNINMSDSLLIVGFLETSTPNVVVATLVERLNASSMAIVQGPVSAKTSSVLTILGITVTTGGSTEFRRSNPPAILLAAPFFAAVTPGATIVKARGVFTAPTALNVNVTDGEAEIEE